MRVLFLGNPKLLDSACRLLLQQKEFVVDVARNGREGEQRVSDSVYDVIVLDLTAPELCGVSLLKSWREEGVNANVLALTPDTLEDVVRSLDLGADDCLTEPFEVVELFARLRALGRRRAAPENATVRVARSGGGLRGPDGQAFGSSYQAVSARARPPEGSRPEPREGHEPAHDSPASIRRTRRALIQCHRCVYPLSAEQDRPRI